MWNDRYSGDGLRNWGRVFGPEAMLGGQMGMQAAGTAISAMSTIAGGNTAKTAGDLQRAADNNRADQIVSQEGSVLGAAQRQMLDKQFQTKQLTSTLEARGAAGGVNAGTGSTLATEKSIASRGHYQALMDLFQGQNKVVGMENEANDLRYSGDVAEWEGATKKKASRLAALGTIAGGGASMAQSYGAFAYPNQFGRPGVGY